jgi:hypothetical protein
MSPARRSGARAATPSDDVLSALVIVRAASGRQLATADAIDASNLAEHAASPTAVSALQQAYGARGFDVGPFVGISFAIAARRSQFEREFGVLLSVGRDGAVTVRRQGRAPGSALPLDRLPASLREYIETVTFTPPAEFHTAPMI